MKIRNIFLAALAALALASCAGGVKHFKFDGSREISGTRFALRDINPDLPRDWDEYNYLVLEYKITTPQRFQFGLTTDDGYNELRLMSYVPGAWNRLVIPLRYFEELPDPAFDMAATVNHRRTTGWIKLGGSRGPLHGVDSVGVRMRRAIGEPEIFIRNISLAVEDPGDAYLETEPAYDRFGQSTRMDYPEKVSSLEELQAEWRAEEEESVSTEPYNYSQYGGYRQRRLEATGFFRTAKVDDRWWFVDPEGYVFLSLGVDCMAPGGGGDVRDYDTMPAMYEAMPPEDEVPAMRRGDQKAYSIGQWNQYRRFGADWREKANELIIKRMDKWGLNTIANWSSRELAAMGRKAFLLSFGGIGQDAALMGLADVYAPDFKATVDASISRMVLPNRDNPWLIGYFVGNEPAWIGDEPRLCQIILDGPDRPIRTALRKYLDRHGDSDAARVDFIYESFDSFLSTVQATFRKYDPNHLNLGMRLASPNTLSDKLLAICGKHFDVFSFNAYTLTPDRTMLDNAYRLLGIPMMVGEFHFGTVDRGLAQSLIQTRSQTERAECYRYYTENAYSHPAFIGTAYFQWCDEDFTGRFDGENFNCGLIDVTDRPYREQAEAMMETGRRLYDIHSGSLEPYSTHPDFVRDHEALPD
jgi:hypothetical protein